MDRNVDAGKAGRSKTVALRKESVDRNTLDSDALMHAMVALRKESVDRNFACTVNHLENTAVALRKESVDRNTLAINSAVVFTKSLSARRAWIEIGIVVQPNSYRVSLSARRAWIEISFG